MNKTANTAIFLLIATVANLIIMAAILIIPQVVLLAIFRDSLKDVFPYIQLVLFPAAFIGGFFIYNVLLNLVRKKINIEELIHPLFARRPPSKKD